MIFRAESCLLFREVIAQGQAVQWLCRRRPGGTVSTCPGHLLLLNELMRPRYHSYYHQAADIWGVPGAAGVVVLAPGALLSGG